MSNSQLRRSRWGRGIMAAAALAATVVGIQAGVQVAFAPAASAAPSGVVSAASATSTAPYKFAVATCPAGTRVFGGGGDIVGGDHAVALTGLRPASTVVGGRYVDTFTAIAETDGSAYPTNWTVYAYAICGPNLPGLTVQRATLQPAIGATQQSASVSCPSGTAPLGLGAEITGGTGHVVLNTLLGNYVPGPYGVPQGFSTATGYVGEHGYTRPWNLTSYAVCAAPPPGLTYRFADSAVNSSDKSAGLECPAGTKVYGVGGYLEFRNGETHFDRMVPHGSQWTGADVEGREDRDGFAYNWFDEVEGICAQ